MQNNLPHGVILLLEFVFLGVTAETAGRSPTGEAKGSVPEASTFIPREGAVAPLDGRGQGRRKAFGACGSGTDPPLASSMSTPRL